MPNRTAGISLPTFKIKIRLEENVEISELSYWKFPCALHISVIPNTHEHKNREVWVIEKKKRRRKSNCENTSKWATVYK